MTRNSILFGSLTWSSSETGLRHKHSDANLKPGQCQKWNFKSKKSELSAYSVPGDLMVIGAVLPLSDPGRTQFLLCHP